MAIPKEGYFKYEQGRYGPLYPRTPANYGFTIIAKIKPGREETVRGYGKTIEDGIAGDPTLLAPLKLHYLRWVLFDVGSDTYFMYQGIFDTDFDKYTEDAIALFTKTGINTVFENLEGFPMDWKTNAPALAKKAPSCASNAGSKPLATGDIGALCGLTATNAGNVLLPGQRFGGTRTSHTSTPAPRNIHTLSDSVHTVNAAVAR